MEPNLKLALDFCRSVLPGWRGRKIHVRVSERPKRLTSMWDGGSKDSWVGVQISTRQLISLPLCGFMNIQPDYIPTPGVCLVEHSIFCGKDAGCTLHLHPEDLGRFSQGG